MSFLKIKDPTKRDFLVNELIKTRRAIYNDSMSEQLGDMSRQQEISKLFKPVTSELSESRQAIHSQLEDIKKHTEATNTALSYLPQAQLTDTTTTTPALAIESALAALEIGEIATQYLTHFGKSDKSVDRQYGLRSMENGRWYIGNVAVSFNDDNIIVGDKEFQGTPGLWELITSSNPDENLYDTTDMINYKTILLMTNALKRNYDSKETHPVASKSDKWKNLLSDIWKELYPKTTTTTRVTKSNVTPASKSSSAAPHVPSGSGTTSVIVLPSDPYALLDRLDILIASKKAGNSGVLNEITSILDELLRQQIITVELYKQFNKF